MPDFLLELLSEEIPARMQAKAETDLARLFAEQLVEAGLKAEAVETFSTPRRLALIARGLPAETAAVSEELKGPRASAPPQALEGFLRKTGLTRDQLVERDGILFALIDRPGRATSAVLADAIPAIVRAFPWPKSMRWGEASASTESIRWVRPLQGIVALLGEEIVECEIAGVKSGAATVGHRFHHPGIITIGGAHDYAEKLRACHVIVDAAERRKIIEVGAVAAVDAASLVVIRDDALMIENAGLTEWPVPLLGNFNADFLRIPSEVIQLTMRTNQKYFACMTKDGGLTPNFICTANIEASDGGAAIVAGNERVLSARLSDAKFFWEQDLKIPLEEQAKKLDQIVFHEKLGTLADKVDRVAKLARWLVEEGIIGGSSPSTATIRHSRESGNPASSTSSSAGLAGTSEEQRDSRFRGNDEELANQAETAARLCKADLVTAMVGEFPELQGIIGGHLARAQGQPQAIADAISDHYKPIGQGDEVPTAPVTVAVSLADKLDTLCSFFMIGEPPTGSKDPFALRRAALGAVALIISSKVRFDLGEGVNESLKSFATDWHPAMVALLGEDGLRKVLEDEAWNLFTNEVAVTHFIRERLKIQQRDGGIRPDLIEAVFNVRDMDDLVLDLARVKALQAFVETPEGADLLAGYKRAANILKKEGWSNPSTVTPAEAGVQSDSGLDSGLCRNDEGGATNPLSYTPENEEAQLIAALDAAAPKARAAIEVEDFEGAMAALASLRAPVDAFFDKVTVNDPDPAKREARLDLLARMRDAVHRVADFSKIEG